MPAALSGSENAAISLAGIAVTDSPNTTDILKTTLPVEPRHHHGRHPGRQRRCSPTAAPASPWTGTAAAINAALATSHYTGNLDFYGTDQLAVTTTDTITAPAPGTQNAAITVAPGSSTG